MGKRSDYLIILNNRTSAHTLNNSSRFIKQPFVCDFYRHISVGVIVKTANTSDFDVVFLWSASFDSSY